MQPSLERFLKENPNQTKKDYETKFIGNYKNHHRKIKAVFNSPRILKQKNNQVDLALARVITGQR